MGSRLSYTGNETDKNIIEFCQELILCCVPGFKSICFKNQNEISDFFEGLTSEQINIAFSSKTMEYRLLLEILQKCNIAYNDPGLLPFIQSLLYDKTFFSISKKGNIKRKLTKRIIDKALNKHLLKIIPKEFKFLINNQYFLKYINELFLPLEKDRIIMTIEKFFELSLYEKNSVYNNLNINFNEYEVARKMISNYRKKYKDTLEKYKNDPEYQTIEKMQSEQMLIKKAKMKLKLEEEENSLDETSDDIYIH
jgi:hypothetical protein